MNKLSNNNDQVGAKENDKVCRLVFEWNCIAMCKTKP